MSGDKKLAQFVVDEFLRTLANEKLNGDRGHYTTLTLLERATLMALGNHVRNTAECYPSQEYLGAYLGVSHQVIKRVIKRLKAKNLILAFKKPSTNKRYKTGRHNYYALNLPVDKCVTGITNDTYHNVKGITDNTCHSVIGITGDTVIGITGEPLIEHSNRTIKTKRESTPLSLDFEPDEKTKAVIKSKGYNLEEVSVIADEFLNYYIDSKTLCDDWQAKCRQWFRKEKQQPGFLKKKTNPNEIKSTVKEYQPEPPRVRTPESDQAARQAFAIIHNKLGKPNGLGRLTNEQNNGRLEKGSGGEKE